MSSSEPVVVVNVVAMSFSGSTWINLLLGAHEEAFSIGEIDVIDRTGRPVCSVCGPECAVWSRFDADSTENIYHQVSRLAGRRYLVVNNTRSHLDVQQDPGIEPRFIWVIRDGRAAVASAMRKFPDRSTWRASRGWARGVRKKQQLLDGQAPESILRVSYEALLADTPGELERICDFLGLTRDPNLADNWVHQPHFLAGNMGTLSYVLRAQGRHAYYQVTREGDIVEQDIDEGVVQVRADQRHDMDFYRQRDARNFADERWKTELSDRQLRIFAVAAGRLNRALGYPPALDRTAPPRPEVPSSA
ncbi:MAG: sulfotransferase family protein [Planctomycetota bacterium]